MGHENKSQKLLQELAFLRRRVAELEAREAGGPQPVNAVPDEGEDRFRLLVDHSFDGIFVHDDFQILELNQQLADISGYSRAELLGMRAIDLFTPESQQQIRNYIRSGLKGGYELELRRKDGRIIQVESFGVPCTFHGRQARIVALRDISARKKYETELRTYQEHLEKLVAERTAALEKANAQLQEKIAEYSRAKQALSESEMRLRGIFEAVPVGIGLRDLQGFFLESNPALTGLLGYSREELRTMNLEKLAHPEDQPLHRALFHDLMAGKTDFFEVDLRFYTKDGALRWGHVHAALIRGPDGAPVYSLVIIQDITKEKQAEEAVRTRFYAFFVAAQVFVGLHGRFKSRPKKSWPHIRKT